MPNRFIKMKQAGERFAALTAYDATTARVMTAAGIDLILVGDSLGMVVQGRADTLAVRLQDARYHLQNVVRGAAGVNSNSGDNKPFIVADMPFASFEESPQQAFANAARLMKAGANMVKLEGGADMASTVEFLTQRGIPVCAHIGLLPQKIRAMGAYKVQGRDEEQAQRLLADAEQLQAAGAAMMVLELLPSAVAAKISQALTIPTLGIGSGAQCDGQILVVYDMLGIGGSLRFTRNFMAGAASIPAAIENYIRAVKEGSFPSAEESFD